MASGSKKTCKDMEQPVPHMQAAETDNDVYFMTVALLFAKKSPDPNTKVGACIVNQEGNIVGIGYNKMPNRCNTSFPWERKGDELDTKYPYVCHAELNAVMNKTSVDVKGCTIYVTLFPCNQCAKIIIQSGITGVVYLTNKYKDEPDTQAADKLLKAAGVEPRQFQLKDKLSDLLHSIKPE
ncbi:deoxycytidylate deaminase-like [Clarias gariepinus]|uniref:deoxycytidylate deaminase-like n=1 Tax=Clarias gariepinus TaxID=13013 RepID=UPI00234CCAFE|nr:deoxycytidylate deaminase-like [Clarias gariepinus]